MAMAPRPEQEVRRLVSENRTLVEWSVNRYLDQHRVTGAERDDLVSWGLIGLLSAARAFDPQRGLRFSTLAALAIERSIIRGTMQADSRRISLLSLDEAFCEPTAGESETRWVEMIPDEAALLQLRRAEETAVLVPALQGLRPEQRRLIYAHFFLGYSLADLARESGSTRQALAGQLRRALQALRRGLEPGPNQLLPPSASRS
ncbi:MAG: sigma-70 family RNA polymerase sigma factor [Armatimonadetes bacterium]|nr:sigma-70 family RNA polymerase sigma factor [Armatimonadota bacterium]